VYDEPTALQHLKQRGISHEVRSHYPDLIVLARACCCGDALQNDLDPIMCTYEWQLHDEKRAGIYVVSPANHRIQLLPCEKPNNHRSIPK
jgi:hypothetical protein